MTPVESVFTNVCGRSDADCGDFDPCVGGGVGGWGAVAPTPRGFLLLSVGGPGPRILTCMAIIFQGPWAWRC